MLECKAEGIVKQEIWIPLPEKGKGIHIFYEYWFKMIVYVVIVFSKRSENMWHSIHCWTSGCSCLFHHPHLNYRSLIITLEPNKQTKINFQAQFSIWTNRNWGHFAPSATHGLCIVVTKIQRKQRGIPLSLHQGRRKNVITLSYGRTHPRPHGQAWWWGGWWTSVCVCVCLCDRV